MKEWRKLRRTRTTGGNSREEGGYCERVKRNNGRERRWLGREVWGSVREEERPFGEEDSGKGETKDHQGKEINREQWKR